MKKKKNPSATMWRPERAIQVKVIGICIHGGRLLAMEVYDDSGKVKGVRPLGGRIEFGESREVALGREFQEELNTDITFESDWQVFENIYSHEGQRGHEYMFGVYISLANTILYKQSIIAFSEDSGTENTARWFDIGDFKSGKLELYPDGLLKVLQ